MRLLSHHEARVLSEQIVRKGLPEAQAPDAGDLDSEDPFVAFVRLRFEEPLRANAFGGPAYGRAFTAMSVATIAAGLTSSSIVTASSGEPLSGSTTVAVASLGILVGVLAAIVQLWKPAQRSVARYRAAYASRREGWDYIHDLGRYEGLSVSEGRKAFMTQINSIHQGVESIDESVSEGTTPEANPE